MATRAKRIQTSEMYGSEYKIEKGVVYQRTIGEKGNDSWLVVDFPPYVSENDRKDFDAEMKNLFGAKYVAKKYEDGGEIEEELDLPPFELSAYDNTMDYNAKGYDPYVVLEKGITSIDKALKLSKKHLGKKYIITRINNKNHDLVHEDEYNSSSYAEGGGMSSVGSGYSIRKEDWSDDTKKIIESISEIRYDRLPPMEQRTMNQKAYGKILLDATKYAIKSLYRWNYDINRLQKATREAGGNYNKAFVDLYGENLTYAGGGEIGDFIYKDKDSHYEYIGYSGEIDVRAEADYGDGVDEDGNKAQGYFIQNTMNGDTVDGFDSMSDARKGLKKYIKDVGYKVVSKAEFYEMAGWNIDDDYAKGGSMASGGGVDDYVAITLVPKKTAYKGGKGEVYKNMQTFYDTINSNEDKYPFIHSLHITDSRKANPEDISEIRVYMLGEKSGFDDVEKKGLYDLFGLKKSKEEVKAYAKGGSMASGGVEKEYEVEYDVDDEDEFGYNAIMRDAKINVFASSEDKARDKAEELIREQNLVDEDSIIDIKYVTEKNREYFIGLYDTELAELEANYGQINEWSDKDILEEIKRIHKELDKLNAPRNVYSKLVTTDKMAKGGKLNKFFGKAKSLGKKGVSKGKELGKKGISATKKGVAATKKAIHDKKKDIAYNVMHETLNHRKLSDEEFEDVIKAIKIVDKKYAKGGDIEDIIIKDYGTNVISDYNIEVERVSDGFLQIYVDKREEENDEDGSYQGYDNAGESLLYEIQDDYFNGEGTINDWDDRLYLEVKSKETYAKGGSMASGGEIVLGKKISWKDICSLKTNDLFIGKHTFTKGKNKGRESISLYKFEMCDAKASSELYDLDKAEWGSVICVEIAEQDEKGKVTKIDKTTQQTTYFDFDQIASENWEFYLPQDYNLFKMAKGGSMARGGSVKKSGYFTGALSFLNW